MRVGIIEWDISAMGGRHRTMMAFADYLIGAGYDVTFFSDFSNQDLGRGWADLTFLRWFPFGHLQYHHFEWSVKDRNLTPPPGWNNLDVLLCSYGHWGYLQELLPSVRVITWVIHPSQQRQGNCEVWTNSQTTMDRLRASDWKMANIRIVHPPHDYSAWRDAALPFEQRDIDVVIVGSMLRSKGILKALGAALADNLSVAVLGTVWPAADAENQAVMAEIERLRTRRTIVQTNAPYQVVAKIMGRSKIYLSMSEAESCSLSAYEAMNAGCQIVARDVGAIREQVGGMGWFFRKDDEVTIPLRRALREPRGQRNLITRGLEFDRIAIGKETDCALTNPL